MTRRGDSALYKPRYSPPAFNLKFVCKFPVVGRRSFIDANTTIRAPAPNVGSATTFFSSDSVALMLILDRPGIDDMPPPSRGYDAVECYFTDRPSDIAAVADTSKLLRASPARANVLLFRKACLAPGERLSTGPMSYGYSP